MDEAINGGRHRQRAEEEVESDQQKCGELATRWNIQQVGRELEQEMALAGRPARSRG